MEITNLTPTSKPPAPPFTYRLFILSLIHDKCPQEVQGRLYDEYLVEYQVQNALYGIQELGQ
jgi:hypothetical protein